MATGIFYKSFLLSQMVPIFRIFQMKKALLITVAPLVQTSGTKGSECSQIDERQLAVSGTSRVLSNDEIISNGAFLRPRPRLHVLAPELSKNLHSILRRLDGVRDEF
jgi:hypothetical protein